MEVEGSLNTSTDVATPPIIEVEGSLNTSTKIGPIDNDLPKSEGSTHTSTKVKNTPASVPEVVNRLFKKPRIDGEMEVSLLCI